MVIKRILSSIILAVSLPQSGVAAVYFTAKCSQFGHPEFQINVSDKKIPRADVDWFLSTLEGMVAGGERFRLGETMQIGWMIIKLEPGDKIGRASCRERV